MKDNTKLELMKLLDITDNKVADSVIDYAYSLAKPDRQANDHALAKAINERVYKILSAVHSAYKSNSFEDYCH